MADDENPAKEINRELAKLAERVAPDSKVMQVTLIRIANQIVNDAKRNVAQQLTMRTGKLRRSIGFRMVPDGVEIGTFGVPYGAIHEFGGVIRPRRRTFLTIPADKPFVGRSALFFNLRFGRLNQKPYLFTEQKKAAYRLVKRVTIKEKPYLRPAIRKNEKFAIQLIREALAGE